MGISRTYSKAIIKLKGQEGTLDQRGVNRLAVSLLLLLCASILWTAYQILPFYYDYWELEGLMQQQARHAEDFKDDEIRKTILAEIKSRDIPIDDEQDLKINRAGGKMEIDLEYDEVLSIPWKDKDYDIYVFHFNPHADQKY